MKPFKHEIQKKKWDKLRRRKLITSITIGGCSALVFAGAGVGVGYFVWHTKTNKTPDEIKPSLSFEKGGNNELSSTKEGDEKNTITLNASFNQKVWWASISLTSGCEDIFQDDFVEYSNDGGENWRSSSSGVNVNGDNGVYFWFNSYNTSGSIIFRLLKPYTDDKLVNFTLAYCPKENEPAIESDESASVLFLKNTTSDPETIKDINFHLFDNKTVISKTVFLSELTNQLGGLFTHSSPLSSPPTTCEQATNCLCQSIKDGGISNAASIAALIACENYSVLSSKPSTTWASYDSEVTFDLEISYIHKNNNNDHFAFDFSQHWKKAGADQDGLGESGILNYRYDGIGEKFVSQNPPSGQHFDTYLSVDKTIRNWTGTVESEASNRATCLSLITQDLAQTIYPGVNNFPTWMFPNS